MEKTSFYSTALLFFMTCFLIHGLCLINNAVFWDGAILVGYYRENNSQQLHFLFNSMGLPIFYYLTRLLWFFDYEKVTNYIAPISIYLAAMFTYLSAKLYKQISDPAAFLIGIFLIIFPGSMITYFHAITHYYIMYALFFAGIYTGLKAERVSQSSGYYVLHGLSLILFFLSFSLKSLLVYYSLFLLCLYVLYRESHTKRSFFYKRIDFILLPVLFWIISAVYFKPFEQYQTYNQINLLGAASLFNDFERSIYQSVFRFLTIPLFLFGLTAIFYLIWQWHLGTLKNIFTKPAWFQSKKNYLMLVLLGVLALVMALLPYILVGKPPMYTFLPATRNALLIPSAVSLILTGIIMVFFFDKNKINFLGKLFLFFILSYLSGYWIQNYLNLEGEALLKQSIVAHLKSHPEWGAYSIYWVKIHDFSDIEKVHAFYEWAFILNQAYGGHSRIGYADQSSDAENFSKLKLAMHHLSEKKFYNLQNLNMNGKQANLDVTQPVENGLFSLNLNYLYYRFLKPEQLNHYIYHVADVKVTPRFITRVSL